VIEVCPLRLIHGELMIETIGNLRAKWQVEELDSEEKWTDVMKAIGSLMKSDKLLGVRLFFKTARLD
jgi:hypothetical protein